MEFTPRMIELYAEMGDKRSALFIKTLCVEFGLSIGEAKGILIELEKSEHWERNGFKNKSLLAMDVNEDGFEDI